MARLIKSSGTKATVVEAAKGVKALKAHDDHAHGGFDPHAWQDVANARIYVANIREALSTADPAGEGPAPPGAGRRYGRCRPARSRSPDHARSRSPRR